MDIHMPAREGGRAGPAGRPAPSRRHTASARASAWGAGRAAPTAMSSRRQVSGPAQEPGLRRKRRVPRRVPRRHETRKHACSTRTAGRQEPPGNSRPAPEPGAAEQSWASAAAARHGGAGGSGGPSGRAARPNRRHRTVSPESRLTETNDRSSRRAGGRDGRLILAVRGPRAAFGTAPPSKRGSGCHRRHSPPAGPSRALSPGRLLRGPALNTDTAVQLAAGSQLPRGLGPWPPSSLCPGHPLTPSPT